MWHFINNFYPLYDIVIVKMSKLLPIIELKTTTSLVWCLIEHPVTTGTSYGLAFMSFYSCPQITVNVCFPSVVTLIALDMFGPITVFLRLTISWAVPRGSWWLPHGASIRLRRASRSPSSLFASTKSGESAIKETRNRVGIGLSYRPARLHRLAEPILDINLTKDSSLLLHGILSPLY